MWVDRRRSRALVAVVALASTASGCFTSLGYVPEHMKPRNMAAASNTLIGEPADDWSPSYPEVKKWAYDVADGYDSRVTTNRYALYWGAFVAAAGAGALAGLAVFDAGSGPIQGIPIGTGFLASVLGYYNNDSKAAIYDLGSRRVRDFIIRSDARLVAGAHQPDEAICLRQDVADVMNKVADHSRLLDPKNVVDSLKAVQAKSSNEKQTTGTTSATTDEEMKKTVAEATGNLDDLKGPARSVCEIPDTLNLLQTTTTALQGELNRIRTLGAGHEQEKKDSAIALKAKADRLKPQADDLVTRASSIGKIQVAQGAQDVADHIAEIQKAAAALSV